MEKTQNTISRLSDKTIDINKKEEFDLSLVDGAIKYLRGVGERAFTDTLIDAVQKAVEALDVDEEIKREIIGLQNKLHGLNNKVIDHKEQITILQRNIQWLKKITETKDQSSDEEVQLAFVLAFMNGVVKATKINTTITGYEAFPGVKEVFNIGEVESWITIDVGSGVRMSKPVKLNWRQKRVYNNMFVSLSHNGVLAIYSNNVVQLRDLVRDKHVDIDVEDETHTGFYDNSLIMLTRGKKLRVCPVDEILHKKTTSVLREIGSANVVPCTDVTLIQTTRVLYFPTTLFELYEFNVDSEEMKVIQDNSYNVCSTVSLTGIQIGQKGLFVSGSSGSYLYPVGYCNNEHCDAFYNCGGTPHIFIPSSNSPTSASKGTLISRDRTFNDNSSAAINSNCVLKYKCYQSLVRLYHDVFLVYEGKTHKWCLMRIFVS